MARKIKVTSSHSFDWDDLHEEFERIPRDNVNKFFCDVLRLMQYAQKDNYDDFDF